MQEYMQKLTRPLTFVYIVLIFSIIYLANTDQKELFTWILKGVPFGDKIGHATLFGLLAFSLNAATNYKHWQFGSVPLYLGSVSVSIFVFVEELSQHFIPSRTMDLNDLLADAVGILFFTLLSRFLHRRKEQSN